ncbi:MAG: Ldh family oxidoreductase [Burkholderiaceae bacterium]
MSDQNQQKRYAAPALVSFSSGLLKAAGMQTQLAEVTAQILVEGDLLGHDTHGMQLLAKYTAELASGSMRGNGEPEVVSERSSVGVWDGRRLPGPFLVQRAIEWASGRAREHGTATLAIRRSHHIACLAAYLEAPARAGLMCTVLSSDPAEQTVAPIGGTRAVFTPNPLAFGIPTDGDPIIIDISASVTTNGMSHRLHRAGQTGAYQWWMTAGGDVTNDPAVLLDNPPGTVLPLGGLDAGHKGYGLALQVEALTGGLAGHGRADPKEGFGATVFVQMTDPEAFAGLDQFNRQTSWIVKTCQENPPRDPQQPVRLPGHRGLARKREQLEQGVLLHPEILPGLQDLASQYGLQLPAPITTV